MENEETVEQPVETVIDETVIHETLVEELLIEEISIDGMCGVY